MTSDREATSDRDAEFDHDAETAIVTGATGGVGSWVVDRLADRGVEVVGIDLERPEGTRANATFRAVDLREQAPTWESIHEIDPDAIVHCAGIADPFETPSTRVFENNTMSAYNVLVAAGRAGVDVVWTSSQASYGALFADGERVPDFLPVDEGHERRPADAYGLSKLCGEEIAKSVARRDGASVTTIRPATIFAPDSRRTRPPRETDDLSADDVGGNFGSYVDVRDVCRLVEAALATDVEGHETVLCAADENYLGRPTAELVGIVCGELPDDCDLEGRQAALSNAKAERVFDWTPAYEWHDLEEEAAGPDWT
ncbi:NAD-dependent epimerase/dehydratase family protein [Natronococcus wangiae]|uniref:NAD-dependent epimerase/dehydratase family protein n=1 Tax=Natronococcus wangiae TaxID=3068275 RepID=UPI00273F71CB|nr:NAD(P)-dependent oxidoreductase [Natronococcus sp. AD5]